MLEWIIAIEGIRTKPIDGGGYQIVCYLILIDLSYQKLPFHINRCIFSVSSHHIIVRIGGADTQKAQTLFRKTHDIIKLLNLTWILFPRKICVSVSVNLKLQQFDILLAITKCKYMFAHCYTCSALDTSKACLFDEYFVCTVLLPLNLHVECSERILWCRYQVSLGAYLSLSLEISCGNFSNIYTVEKLMVPLRKVSRKGCSQREVHNN